MGSAAVFVLLVALVSRQPTVVALPFLCCFCVTSSPCFFRFLSSLHSHSTSRFKLLCILSFLPLCSLFSRSNFSPPSMLVLSSIYRANPCCCAWGAGDTGWGLPWAWLCRACLHCFLAMGFWVLGAACGRESIISTLLWFLFIYYYLYLFYLWDPKWVTTFRILNMTVANKAKFCWRKLTKYDLFCNFRITQTKVCPNKPKIKILY